MLKKKSEHGFGSKFRLKHDSDPDPFCRLNPDLDPSKKNRTRIHCLDKKINGLVFEHDFVYFLLNRYFYKFLCPFDCLNVCMHTKLQGKIHIFTIFPFLPPYFPLFSPTFLGGRRGGGTNQKINHRIRPCILYRSIMKRNIYILPIFFAFNTM